MKNKHTNVLLFILLLVTAISLIWAFDELKSKDAEISNLTELMEVQQKLIL